MFAIVRDNIAATPFHQWLMPVLLSVDEAAASVVIELPFRAELAGQPDRPEFHGGILSALVDIAGHAAIVAKLGRGVATLDLRVDYLRPASGTIRAAATVVKLGKSLGLVDVRVDNARQQTVAVGRAAYFTAA
jgi:uncharacterized protein (TIGR00369 family)